MIRQCRQKKIDLVLVKSISRFAHNTADCLNYVRALRELGIAILFEEQNINTLETDGELLLTLLGAVAQGEDEAISENVKWGKRQAMREGKATIQYSTSGCMPSRRARTASPGSSRSRRRWCGRSMTASWADTVSA